MHLPLTLYTQTSGTGVASPLTAAVSDCMSECTFGGVHRNVKPSVRHDDTERSAAVVNLIYQIIVCTTTLLFVTVSYSYCLHMYNSFAVYNDCCYKTYITPKSVLLKCNTY